MTESRKEKAARLNPETKAFVPSASAAAWKPTSAGGAPVAPAKTGGGSATKPPAPAPAPAAGAWGKKPSNAIKAAPSAAQQQQAKVGGQPKQPERQRSGGVGDSNGWRQSGTGRGSHKGGDDGAGSWARGTRQQSGGGGGRGGRGGRGGGGRRGQDGGGQGDKDGGWARGNKLPTELCKPGEGETDAQKGVTRIRAEDLMALRLSYVAPPLSWGKDETGPPEACLWNSDTRVSEIDAMVKAPRMTGDVSSGGGRNRRGSQRGEGRKNPIDTAPALEDCKPLAVNDGTRWKAKVFDKNVKDNGDKEGEGVSNEEVLKKSLLILNKLSLTKFDKLSDDFIDSGIARNEECLAGAIGLIVEKAQGEPHFASMYAALCLKLARTPLEGIDNGSKPGKKFKKMLLTRCQEEFEQDTATKIAKATEGIEDEEEKAYHANIVKKHYLGHMRLIGELYKGDLISIKIMLFCLPALLEGETSSAPSEGNGQGNGLSGDGEVDEEKIECFSKLMATIGSSLEQQSEAMKNVGKVDASEKLADCWNTVEVLAGRKKKEKGPVVSNRIKFMLQDLIEMRDKGWVTRRKEETAKTIAQIHKEVAKEEARAARRSSSTTNLRSLQHSGSSSSLRRQSSSGDVRRLDRQSSKPKVDNDGFVQVAKMGRSASTNSLSRQNSDGWSRGSGRASGSSMKRSTSGGSFAALSGGGSGGGGGGRRKSNKKDRDRESSQTEKADKGATKAKEQSVEAPAPAAASSIAPAPAVKTYLSPDECGKKVVNILKEYFVGGDTDDAVLSIHELVDAGADGSVSRGAKVVEGGCLVVIEMKEEDVKKFLAVILRCAKESKLENDSFVAGLNDPLEFLSDIVIDAPLAGSHLATIVAEFLKAGIVSFDFLLKAPEYFRTDGNAAQFGGKVLKKMGEGATEAEANVAVIEKLMTDDDKSSYQSASELLAAC